MTLHYEFPQNITLDEVKELIKDNDAFYMVDKEGGYTVVNYLRSGNDVFPPVVNRNTAILRELRGLIFDTETGVVISRPFHKFFNLGEREDVMNFDISMKHIVPTKLDGCCHENTIIETPYGMKTIKEICETKYFGPVLGYDHIDNNICWSVIYDHSIIKDNNDWYELLLEDDTTIKLTGNHLVWCSNKEKYISVSELMIGDELLQC